MPVEASRVTRTIKIPVPGSDELFWPVRVIDQISFLDKARGWQEHVYSYAKNAAAARVTSVVNVGPEGSSIAVERIDALSMRDEREGWQEYIWEFAAPHVRTHDKVIQAVDADGNKNEGVTLTVRRIDAFSFLDKVEGWQETVFDLAWDDAGEYDYLDAGNAAPVSEPYRLDPYQMIVDIKSQIWNWAFLIWEPAFYPRPFFAVETEFLSPLYGILGHDLFALQPSFTLWVPIVDGIYYSTVMILIDLAKVRELGENNVFFNLWFGRLPQANPVDVSFSVELYAGGNGVFPPEKPGTGAIEILDGSYPTVLNYTAKKRIFFPTLTPVVSNKVGTEVDLNTPLAKIKIDTINGTAEIV